MQQLTPNSRGTSSTRPRIVAHEEALALDLDQESYTAHWTKQVSFGSGAHRSIRVEYVSVVGNVAGNTNYAAYQFSGGNWQGQVRQSNIQVDIQPSDFKLQDFQQQGWRENNHRLALSMSDWQAEKTVYVYYQTGVCGYLCPNIDLKGKSARQLTLMRNELYARFGRPFQDPSLRAYFRAQPWYREFPGYTDKLASSYEANARFIAAYQAKHNLNW